MAVLLAYISVVLIWATTPLAIQWSSDGVGFVAAVLLRMSVALAIGLIVNALLRRKLFFRPQVWQIYIAGAIGVFPNMPVVYWSAQYIPSGLIAVIFAISPFVTGLMTFLLLKENPFTVRRLFALVLALSGLVVIFFQQIELDGNAAYGIFGILVSCFLFSFSSVLVKKLNLASEHLESEASKPDAFNLALGSLLFSLPGLLFIWWLLDGALPDAASIKSLAAISYLSVFGSLLGFTLFFYVLGNMSPSSVSLITFVTPILALLLGAWIENELLTWQLWAGVALVATALLIYLDLPFSAWFYAALKSDVWAQQEFLHIKNDHIRFK